jgi:hypothetical protein
MVRKIGSRAKTRVVGTRTTKFKAFELEEKFIKGRKIKPFKTAVVKKGKKFAVIVQEKKPR